MNGKRYDALTGQELGHSKVRLKVVDGFVSASYGLTDATKLAPKKQIAKMKPLTETQLRHQDVSRPIGKHAPKRQVQSSQTLMRTAVKKPAAPSFKRHTKIHSNTLSLVKQPAKPLASKPAAAIVDRNRQSRANLALRSHSLSRFHKPISAAALAQPSSASTLSNWSLEPNMHAQPIGHAKPHTMQKLKTTADVLEMAIQNANSHTETFSRSQKRLPFDGPG